MIAEININISRCSEGLYLRWYHNGWHYQHFGIGAELYKTEGEAHDTESETSLRLGVDNVPERQMKGLKTILFALTVEAYTVEGWKPVVLENTTAPVAETGRPTYSLDIVVTIFARAGLFSPVKPVITDDKIVSFTQPADVTVLIDEAAVLPTTVEVVYQSGRRAQATVTWGQYSTDLEGEFTINGTCVGGFPVSVKLIVRADDLAVLRAIRDANPNSQLPVMWADSKDPYTQWPGITWRNGRVVRLFLSEDQPVKEDASLIHKLTALEELNVAYNSLKTFNMTGLKRLWYFHIEGNDLTEVPTGLTSLGLMRQYDFSQNYLPQSEIDKLIAMGFVHNPDDVKVLLPQKEAPSDVDILKQIRDANPNSQLTTLWADNKDPYTQWSGVFWNSEKTKVTAVDVQSIQIRHLDNINKLTLLEELYCHGNLLTSLNISGLRYLKILYCSNNQLTSLDTSGLLLLEDLYCQNNQIQSLNLEGLLHLKLIYCHKNNLQVLNVLQTPSVTTLYCYDNKLESILSLTSRGNIINAEFSGNRFLQAEVNRLLSIGLTASEIGTQNP